MELVVILTIQMGWLTETTSIPNSVNTVSVILSARCNQGNDRAGFDNVSFRADCGHFR